MAEVSHTITVELGSAVTLGELAETLTNLARYAGADTPVHAGVTHSHEPNGRDVYWLRLTFKQPTGIEL